MSQFNSFNPLIDEGLGLDDSDWRLPDDAIVQIKPGWNLQVKDSSDEFWVLVLSVEPQGFICQVPRQAGLPDSKADKQIFVRPQNIESAMGTADNFSLNGQGLASTQSTTVIERPGAMKYQSYSVYSAGE